MFFFFFFKQKTAYEIGLGIPAEPLFRSHPPNCMFSCLQILEAFLWFVLITLLNVTLIILTLSVSRLLNLLLRLVAFLLFLNPQCLASISRWITASSSWKRFCLFVCRALDRKSGSAGMPRPISYAVFCLKKKTRMPRQTACLRLADRPEGDDPGRARLRPGNSPDR